MARKALIILHQGFEELEAVAPIDILRRGGVEVTVASHSGALDVTGRNNITVKADVAFGNLIGQTDGFDCLLLPGGPGIPQHLRPDPRIAELAATFAASGKIVAAICAAPLVLKDAGLLANIPYTAHFSTAPELDAIDASSPVVKAANIITSRGAGTATRFGLAVLTALTDEATAQEVAESICF